MGVYVLLVFFIFRTNKTVLKILLTKFDIFLASDDLASYLTFQV